MRGLGAFVAGSATGPGACAYPWLPSPPRGVELDCADLTHTPCVGCSASYRRRTRGSPGRRPRPTRLPATLTSLRTHHSHALPDEEQDGEGVAPRPRAVQAGAVEAVGRGKQPTEPLDGQRLAVGRRRSPHLGMLHDEAVDDLRRGQEGLAAGPRSCRRSYLEVVRGWFLLQPIRRKDAARAYGPAPTAGALASRMSVTTQVTAQVGPSPATPKS